VALLPADGRLDLLPRGIPNLRGGDRPHDRTAATLTALLDLADQLPGIEVFRRRLRARAVNRRGCEGWVAAALVSTEEGVVARLAVGLRPVDLPYSEDIRVPRGYGLARGGWENAVAAARLPRYPGGGPFPLESAVTATSRWAPRLVRPILGRLCRRPPPTSSGHVSCLTTPRTTATCRKSLSTASTMSPPTGCLKGWPLMVACDPEELCGFTTGTILAGFTHTVMSLCDTVTRLARNTHGVDPQRLAGFLSLVSCRSVRTTLVRELGAASGGSQSLQQHQWDREALRGEPQDQRHQGPSWGWERSGMGPS